MINNPVMDDDEGLLRELGPRVLGVLVRRGADFAWAEDAVQEALIEAVRRWPASRPDNPRGWLVTVAWRKYTDAVRADAARARREEREHATPAPGPARQADDTLLLLFLACHPALTPASTVAPDVAGGRRSDDGADRPGVYGSRADHGPAHQPCQSDAARQPPGRAR